MAALPPDLSGSVYISEPELTDELVVGVSTRPDAGWAEFTTLGDILDFFAATTPQFKGIVDVVSYGAKLDGVTDDSVAFAKARLAAQAISPGCVVLVPSGIYKVNTPPPYTSPPVQWSMLGVTNPDGSPVKIVTVGDEIENYLPTRGKYYQRTDPLGETFPVGALHQPVLQIDYTGKGSSLGILQVNGIQNDGSGFLWGVEGNLTLNQPGMGQCVAVAGAVTRVAPSSPGFGLYGQFIDNSGTAGSSSIGAEVDVFTNGPEPDTTLSAPGSGFRVVAHIVAQQANHATWAANTVYATGAVINPSGQPLYVYIATTGGTSGGSEPTWPTSAGTVNDGSVVWSFGTTLQTQISRVVHISGTGLSSQIACPLYFSNMDVYDAIIDMANGNITQNTGINPNVAAIRMGPDWPIDFSGAGTTVSQNRRILRYNSTTNNLEYVYLGSPLFSVADTTGAVAIGGAHTVGYQLQVLGTNTVGIATNGGTFTTALRMGSDQTLSFEGTDAHYLQYRAATQRLYYVVGGVDQFSIDASGNVRARGTITGSTTP